MSDWSKQYDERKRRARELAVASGFAARAKAFHEELEALQEKHQVILAHEDGHGSFLYQDAIIPTADEDEGTEVTPYEVEKWK